VDDELEIKAYYAGHVLGAAMVQIKVGSESVVYTVSISLLIELGLLLINA
jgi:Cft2 family RNA processing exonuclease